jgi:hypothetical protein
MRGVKVLRQQKNRNDTPLVDRRGQSSSTPSAAGVVDRKAVKNQPQNPIKIGVFTGAFNG